jgi:hypothetical protein
MSGATFAALTLTWLPALVALQSIPHTGALRTLLLLMGLLHLAYMLSRHLPATWPRPGGELLWLALLTSWLIAQSAFISPEPWNSLSSLASEWSKVLLMAAIGIAVVAFAARLDKGPVWVALGLFVGYFVHVVSTLGYQVWSYWSIGAPTPGMAILGNYGYASPFVTGASAFLIAEVVIRMSGRSWLPIPGAVIGLMIVASVAALGALASKASTIVAIAMLLAAAATVVKEMRLHKQAAFFAAGIALVIAASVSVSNRWQGAAEAITATIDSPADAEIISASPDPQAPINRLSHSYFVRAMSLKIGIEGVSRHPFGLGYGADAFGRYVVEQGGLSGFVSSESGWLDFALANGIPGLLLLLALFVAIMRRGWVAFRAGSPAGLAAALFTLNFAVRSALDGHLAGSRLTGFAFVAAALWAMTFLPHEARRAGNAD